MPCYDDDMSVSPLATNPRVPLAARLVLVLVVSGLVGAASCQGSAGGPAAPGVEPVKTGPSLTAAAPGAGRPAVAPAPATTTFPAVDVSRLEPAGRAFFVKVANEEVCPCDCPKSLGQCLQEGTACKPAVVLAEWIIKSLEAGISPESLQEPITRELTGGFAGAARAPALDGFASKGSAQARYTVVEYADFECGHCRVAAGVVDQLVKSRGDVRVVYKHYPLPFHPMARLAAIATEAAARQGKFWEMHAAVFATQDMLSEDLLRGHARAIGLDSARFEKDFADPALAAKVDGSRAEGQSFGIGVTPYFFVNGRPFFLPRSLEALDVRFRMEDARATSTCQ